MARYTVWILAFFSIGFGVIFYGLAYVIVRPILAEMGIIALIPSLGGATAVLGAAPIVVFTWVVFVRLFTMLGIDKM